MRKFGAITKGKIIRKIKKQQQKTYYKEKQISFAHNKHDARYIGRTARYKELIFQILLDVFFLKMG